MSAEDRDQLFEKALARQLREGKDAKSAACPDAETLAAYHERLLSEEELSADKKHLVSCTRCQEILAQLEATQDLVESQDQQTAAAMELRAGAPVQAAGDRGGSSRSALPKSAKVTQLPARKNATPRWAAPLGAIAAVLLLWIGAREFRMAKAPRQSTQIAENRNEGYLPAPAQPATPPAEDRPGENPKEASPNVALDDKASAGLRRNSRKLAPQNAPEMQTPSAHARAGSFQAGAGSGVGVGAGAGMGAKSQPAEEAPSAEKADAGAAASGKALGGVAGGLIAKKAAAPVPAAAKANKDEAKSLQDRGKSSYPAGRPDTSAGASAPPAAVPPPPPPAPAKARASTRVSGQLRGTVTDPSGAAVSGANVALKSENGSTVSQTSTDNTGTYAFDGVASGNYQLELQSPGFKTESINGLNIAAGDNVQNAQLQVGTSAETVEVSAQAAVLNTQSAEVSSLPLNGRNVQALVLLSAGLQTVTSPDGKVIWKFGDAGQIVFSENAGKDWTSQRSGVSAKLLAASAPSAKICWIAGASGTLLRTTDGGRSWRRITIPIAVDLAGVNATDANHAAIWNVTNQLNYQTADGGATWQKAANP